jgi:hypothetical protein
MGAGYPDLVALALTYHNAITVPAVRRKQPAAVQSAISNPVSNTASAHAQFYVGCRIIDVKPILKTAKMNRIGAKH